jgi:hypothetical protein
MIIVVMRYARVGLESPCTTALREARNRPSLLDNDLMRGIELDTGL